MRSLTICLLGLLLLTAPARAIDYAKIERILTNEPNYKSRAPRYALLLFGPEVKVRVWVVLDGEAVYVDQNGDGDLTGKDERFGKLSDCKDIAITDPDGKTHYVITSISQFSEGNPPQPHLMVNVDIKGPFVYQEYCDAEMGISKEKAPIAHFHGPLAIGPRTILWKVPPKLALKTGEEPTDLPALVGTMDAEHRCWVVVRSHKGAASAFPNGVCPAVDVEYPSKTPAGFPVKKHYLLDKFC